MRIAILGVGHWHAGMHARGVVDAGADIAGVWDPDPAAISRFIADHRGTRVADPSAALADRPDLVIALGRGPEAATRLAWLIEQGVPILADKPIGISHADVAPLAEAAARGNRFVAVALVNRISGVGEAIGGVGKVTHVYFRINNGHPRRYRDWGVPWMLDIRQSGGGALRNLGVHGIDAFLALAGDQTVSVEHAAFRSVYGEAVEDYACVVLRAADGTLGIVEAGYTHPDTGGSYEFRINAEQASLVDTGAKLLTVPERPAAVAYVPSNRRYSVFVADTLARLEAGRAPAVTLADFARATDMVDRAYGLAH
jgi:predicted dehydrogenase